MNKLLSLICLVSCLTFLYGIEAKSPKQELLVKSIEPLIYISIIIDLKTDQYLQRLQIAQTELPTKIQTSSDGIGYDTIPTQTLTTINPLSYDLTGYNGRYIKISNSSTVNCSAIKIYAAPDFRLSYIFINALPSSNECTLSVKTFGKGYMQVLYGLNYDFIYNKTLLGIYSNMSMTNTETIQLKDLQPETTYRYQFKFSDLKGKTIESNYFTFTTLPLVK